MKKLTIAFLVIIAMMISTVDSFGQKHHNKDHRKQQKTERELVKAKSEGKVDAIESAAISEKKAKLQRREDKAHRRGGVRPAEDRKIDRAQRQLKREVRRAKRN